MRNYLDLLDNVLTYGLERESRAGPTLGIFGEVLEFDLTDGFPAVTTKKLNFNAIADELAGFLRAETDASKMGSKIWKADALRWYNEEGSKSSGPTDMGINYGVLWRKWPAYYYSCQVDQLREVVDRIKTNPTDRRLVVTAWHPEFIKDTCLPPCHYAYQFYVASNAYGTYLDCIVHMRSVDCFLGLPFDIASYALLMHIVAQETKLKPCKLIMTLGDTHIYKGHTAQVKEQINRIPYALPKLILQEEATIDNFAGSMAALANYTHHSAIKGDLYVG